MKNIHVLPTDKPSRLYKRIDLSTFHLGDFDICKTDDTIRTNQHIYITANEEIKEGDYYITPNNTVLKALGPMLINVEDYKKIILTTDFRLAPDVQKIDDEFLEWFVNNSNCEEVKIEPIPNSNWGFDLKEPITLGYKIIIPKKT